jgi:predicted unusual protein kinase regulating ubiquinone biosynthesis (AarF/ABC1/UbiB family)
MLWVPACRVLEALQDRVPPRSFAVANHVLQQELGAPVEQLFAEFELLATAAASLAQVHKARLHDGTQVAVKVQVSTAGSAP